MSTVIPNVAIQPASPSDIPRIVEFVYASKLQLTINRLLYEHWPNEEAQVEHCNDVVRGAFDTAQCEVFKAIDNDTGRIVGHLVLTHLKENEEGESDTQREVPTGMVPEIVDLVMNTVAELDKDVKKRNRLEITHMYIESSYQRRGIGSEMVRLALRKAKDAKVPLYTVAEPQARPFFLKLHFTETAFADIDLSKHAPEHCGFGLFRFSAVIVDRPDLQ